MRRFDSTLRIAMVLAYTLGGLYAAELGFRTLALTPSVPKTARQFDEIVATHWPRPVPDRKEPGTIRILGLADSFGLAGGERNYHFIVEDLLRSRGHRVEVVNLSVGAYSPAEELELLREFGARYEPDIVLHGFFVGNDFALPGPETFVRNGLRVEKEPGLRSWYPQNLLLPRWLARWHAARRESGAGSAEGTRSREAFLAIERVRLSACRRPAKNGPVWPMTTRVLDSIKREIESMGAVHVLVVHPDRLQVEPALVDEILETFGLHEANYDLSLPLRYLETYASSRNVPMVDLTPAFRKFGSEGSLYLPGDTLYSDRGNELAAAIIARELDALLKGTLSFSAPNEAARGGTAEPPHLGQKKRVSPGRWSS